jgi:hypothetical protein
MAPLNVSGSYLVISLITFCLVTFLTQAIPVTLNGIAFDVQNITTRDVWCHRRRSSRNLRYDSSLRSRQIQAVVDHEDGLGGHTATYHSLATSYSFATTLDIGVVIWPDQPIVRNYFAA